MANPQPDKFVKISNELFNHLCGFRIPGEVRLVFDTIIRKTWGFNKKEDYISLSQFVEITGLKKSNVVRSLSKLITHNLIIKTDNERGSKFSIQKDYERWTPLSELITTIIRTDNKQPQKNQPQTLSEVIPTKDKRQYYKRNIKLHSASANGLKIIKNKSRRQGFQSLSEIFSGDTETTMGAKDEAVRIAKYLGIEINQIDDQSLKAQWFKFFIQAYQRHQQPNLQNTVSSLIDSSSYQSLDIKGKIKIYFWKFYHPYERLSYGNEN